MSRSAMPQSQVLDTLASYDQVARELSGRATARDLWLEGCVEPLNRKDTPLTTAELAHSIGEDHNTMRTAFPGMVALGLAKEYGADSRTKNGRPPMLFKPTANLVRFVSGYNNMRTEILQENLPPEIEQLGSSELEAAIFETFAAARGAQISGIEITLGGVASALRMHPEAIRFRGFNSFTAAYSGLTGAIARRRDHRVIIRSRS